MEYLHCWDFTGIGDTEDVTQGFGREPSFWIDRGRGIWHDAEPNVFFIGIIDGTHHLSHFIQSAYFVLSS